SSSPSCAVVVAPTLSYLTNHRPLSPTRCSESRSVAGRRRFEARCTRSAHRSSASLPSNMAGDADPISEDQVNAEEGQQQQQQQQHGGATSSPAAPRKPSHRLYSANTSTSSGSESESDVREQQLHLHDQQRPQQSTRQPIHLGGGGGASSTSSSKPTTTAAPAQQEQEQQLQQQHQQQSTHLQLVPCKVCAASASFAHCLTARGRNGERHVPRLRVVRGPALRKRSKAQLLPGQREAAAAADGPTSEGGASPLAEDGSSEPLPLTAENLGLRFRVPCERCKTLAMCSNKDHPVQVKTLSELVQLPPGGDGGDDDDSDSDGDDGGHGGVGGDHPPGRVKEEAREHSEPAEEDGTG
ncbi:unnamed protein product, partial [Scytosiphon promiscuus]